MGIPWKLLYWIEDYLTDRCIRTKLNNCISSSRMLRCGVPQGSILGPTLFLCYINDLALTLKNLDANVSLYADDAVIYHSDNTYPNLKPNLEKLFSMMCDWSKCNYVNINIQKTKFCIYGYKSRVRAIQDLSLSARGQKISRCHQYNYLGVLLDECMTLSPNFNNIYKKYSHKTYQFGKIRRYMSVPTRILVYKQTILPLVEYVSFMLCLNSTRDIEKLQRLQNRCLRLCLDVNNPVDMSTIRLHEISRINMLNSRRDVQLLNVMFSLKLDNKYKKESVRVTRNAERYVFDTDIVHKDIYANSPYYKGVVLWNGLDLDIQDKVDKTGFKNCVKRLLNIV